VLHASMQLVLLVFVMILSYWYYQRMLCVVCSISSVSRNQFKSH